MEDVSSGSVVGHTILDALDSTCIPPVYVTWLLVKAIFILVIFLWLLTLGKLLTQSILWEDIPIQFGIIQHWIEIFAAEKKKNNRSLWFYESPSASRQGKNQNMSRDNEAIMVQCQLKDFFQCQMHLEYGGQKWRYLYGVPELWWNLLVIYSWRLPSSWSCVANRQQLPTPFPTWAVCAKRIGSSVEISSREWKLTITYC